MSFLVTVATLRPPRVEDVLDGTHPRRLKNGARLGGAIMSVNKSPGGVPACRSDPVKRYRRPIRQT